ncbi:uncharacterized protein VICG_02091 [Vittaforma corneae ATCC 50505]|uniref:Uncharacterized protein n=1 Tax=Vittaforma corneae (strain ATCC 50505) TaxID=993615 RepID=L2GKQ5_VITCO|nr:uncharacterized protein VICG_02091 [Vittaforma corneae ATCC 50505]ELA40877.1 hypothetical protein VICG_02091 [Vittaforma corneae ATCC 50505]
MVHIIFMQIFFIFLSSKIINLRKSRLLMNSETEIYFDTELDTEQKKRLRTRGVGKRGAWSTARKIIVTEVCLLALACVSMAVLFPNLTGVRRTDANNGYSDVPSYLDGYMDGSILINKAHFAEEIAFYHMYTKCMSNLADTYDKVNHFLRTNKGDITTLVGDEKWKEIVDTVETTRKNVLQAIRAEGENIESTTFDMWKELYEFKDVKGNTTSAELADVSSFIARGELLRNVDQESLQQADAKLMSIIDTKNNAILSSISDAEKKIYALMNREINEASFFAYPMLKMSWWYQRFGYKDYMDSVYNDPMSFYTVCAFGCLLVVAPIFIYLRDRMHLRKKPHTNPIHLKLAAQNSPSSNLIKH